SIHTSAQSEHHHRDHVKSLASSNRLARLQAASARSTDSPERRQSDSPEISHYDKRLSKVGLQEAKLRNKRLAARQQLQSLAKLKRMRSNSVDNLSDLSDDDELEIVENMDHEMEENEADAESEESVDEADCSPGSE